MQLPDAVFERELQGPGSWKLFVTEFALLRRPPCFHESETNNARQSNMVAEVTGVFASRALATPVQITFEWTTSLKLLPKICMKDVETFVTSEKAPKTGLTKGYKFFCEEFIHKFQSQCTEILRVHLFLLEHNIDSTFYLSVANKSR